MTFHAFGPPLQFRRPTLGINPPEVIDTGQAPRVSGEPSLTAALAPLTSDEVADYQTWGPKEKTAFLAGYQYVAVATAAGLRRPDGSSFDGFLTRGISLVLGAMDALQNYIAQMPADMASLANQGTSVLKDASQNAEPNGISFSSKYQLLRDRVAWELATQNNLTIEYEILGTDPANPGLIYTRKIGEDRAPDYSAVFSTDSPADFWSDGLSLEDKFDSLGVTFKKLSTLGVNPRMGAGPALILAVLITIVVAILSFFWLWNHVNQNNQLTHLAASLISGDSTLSATEKANRLVALRNSNSFFAEVFGTSSSSIPWAGILIALGLGALAFITYPFVVKMLKQDHTSHHRHRYLPRFNS